MAVRRWLLVSAIVAISAMTVIVVGTRQARHQQDMAHRIADLDKLSALVATDIDLSGLSDLDKAIAIRHYIYANHLLGNDSQSDLDQRQLADAWAKITARQEPVICGWLALIYIAALESQDIPARYVGIFSDTEQPYHSHASVEVYINGRWIISDPTFNIMFRGNSGWLSWTDLYHGASYGVVTNGQGEPIQWQDYYIGLDDLLKYVVIHDKSLILLPADWGQLAYRTDSPAHQFLRGQR